MTSMMRPPRRAASSGPMNSAAVPTGSPMSRGSILEKGGVQRLELLSGYGDVRKKPGDTAEVVPHSIEEVEHLLRRSCPAIRWDLRQERRVVRLVGLDPRCTAGPSLLGDGIIGRDRLVSHAQHSQ